MSWLSTISHEYWCMDSISIAKKTELLFFPSCTDIARKADNNERDNTTRQHNRHRKRQPFEVAVANVTYFFAGSGQRLTFF